MSDRTEIPHPSCPVCGKQRAVRYRPFCSKRCADVDLNRWLTGRYAIPVMDCQSAFKRDPQSASNFDPLCTG